MEHAREFLVVWSGVFGLVVGSLLNVAIHRLPLEGLTVQAPATGGEKQVILIGGRSCPIWPLGEP